MRAYIKDRRTFRTLMAVECASYELVTDSAESENSVISVEKGVLSSANTGDWLYFGSRLYLISALSPGEETDDLTLLNAIDAFSRRLLYKGEAASIEAFIVSTLTEQFVNCPDTEYALPYLSLRTESSTAFAPPELDSSGLFSLSDYLRTVRSAYRIRLALTLSGDSLRGSVGVAQPAEKSISFSDGHHRLESCSFGNEGAAKLSLFRGEEERVYYLQGDGSVSMTAPSPRISGAWDTESIREDAEDSECMSMAVELLSRETDGHSIYFLSDREYPLYTPITLRIGSEPVKSRISSVSLYSSDGLWHYHAGDFSDGLVAKLKAIGVTAEQARRGSQGSAVERSVDEIPREYTVSYLDTVRYVGENRAWRTVRVWQSQYGFSTKFNVVGKGTQHSSALVLLPGFPLQGAAAYILLKMRVYSSSETVHSFRWALCTARNDSLYESFGAVTDASQVGAGTFTTEVGGTTWQSFRFDCDVPGGVPLYLYLWADVNQYGNIHIYDELTVSCVDVVERN